MSLFTVDINGNTNRFYVFDTGRLGDKGYPSICSYDNNTLLMSYYKRKGIDTQVSTQLLISYFLS